MSLDLDLGGVASAGTPLPEGDYSFLIEDAIIKTAKSGTSHNLRMKLTVTSADENGRVHSENLNIQEKTRPFVKAFLTALWGVEDSDIEKVVFNFDEGADVNEGAEVRGINDRPIVGSEIGATIKHVDGDEDQVYANVVAWFTL